MDLMELDKRIEKWGRKNGIMTGATSKDQFIKMVEEVGEVGSALNKGKLDELLLEIGDVYVTLSLFARLNGTSLTECVNKAYSKIENREGEMRNGTLVKEEDL